MSLYTDLGIDGLIITGATNRRYYSGWSADDHAPDRPSGVMVVTPHTRVLYASPTNLPWAEAEVHEDVTPRSIETTWVESIAAAIAELGLSRVGFEDALVPVASYWQLQSQLGNTVELVPAGNAVDQQRQVKDERELAYIRKALSLTDQAFEHAAAQLREGMTERELAHMIDQSLRNLGSDGQAFDTIVASGPNAAKPHHAPGDRAIVASEPVIIDMGARVHGYCGDLTRTIWVGQPGDQLGTMYRLVAEAQRAAIAAVAGGVGASEVDRAVREVFAAAGLDQYFVHGTGHAIGLRIHEAPFLGRNSQDILQTGNVVTIEPGIYIPGWGGVRIEDVVVVTDDGCENLTASPKLLGH
jgi:Xaa-Pro aminopeptidase